MADELTAAGLSIDSFETRNEAHKTALRAAIAPNLDLSTEQPSGQVCKIEDERAQDIAELLRAIYSAWDPDSSTGHSLTALAAITGTHRLPATYGSVTLTVNLNAGITLPAGSVAAVSGDAENRWVTDVDVTNGGGAPASLPVAATAEDTGPIQALAGTITVMATPVAGWNFVTNAADATPGEDEESDADLFDRWEDEKAIGGSTTVDAIQAQLTSELTADGLEQCVVYENTSAITVDSMPPKSVEAVLWDGAVPAVANADIVRVIWETKAGGMEAYGTSTANHTDTQGVIHAVGFTRATALRILVDITLDVDGDYVGDTAVEDAIEAWAADALGIGDDVYRSKISGVAIDLGGVLNVSAVLLSIHPAAVGAVDIAVGVREIATIDSADVTVHS